MGDGAWRDTPQQRKPAIMASIVNMRAWAHALLTEPTPLQAFRSLDIPVLYMVGTDSPPSSQAVARLLTGVLPQVEVVTLEGLGHMGPVTHPETVNEAIARFFDRV